MKELAKTTNVPRECATLGLINKCVIFWLTTQKSEDGVKEEEEKGGEGKPSSTNVSVINEEVTWIS